MAYAIFRRNLRESRPTPDRDDGIFGGSGVEPQVGLNVSFGNHAISLQDVPETSSHAADMSQAPKTSGVISHAK
ncbi:hypothetical protein [Polaromonas sp. JS666]|uniref:hypothetical protein n=1 Tax=Polaromonas sp. (strain JS666 / ATCC BAA-500) TaxID=296591 RepID=UPI00059E451D|nr:hypothetical protein [Polaromonas sp. JS666]